MVKAKDYVKLHLNILLFTFTGVFSKLASIQYNKDGLASVSLYILLFLMIVNCAVYAFAWQKIIKKFNLTTAYANRSVAILWSQIWAVVIFHENLTVRNIIGIMIVITGVLVVQKYE